MSRRADLVAIAILAILPFLFFAPVVFGGATLVPADNLYAWEPWHSQAVQLGVGAPHNELLSDLVLENYAWKLFLRRSLSAGDLPLWNPYLFTGVPFLAAGQHSAMYPMSLLFYLLPVERAYGIFSALQLALAAIGTYVFLRSLRASRAGSFVAGVTYAFSGFMVTSVAFTMMIAAAAWLPWCLWAVERVVVGRGVADAADAAKEATPYRFRDGVPGVVLGALFLALQVLAGHVEITYYVLMIMGFFAAFRLGQRWLAERRLPWRRATSLLLMVTLGLGLGAVQLLPLYELVRTNFRSGAEAYRVTYADVVGWAYPLRQAAAFVVPDAFGNPSIHRYLDIVSLRWQPITANALGEAIDQVAWGKGLPTWKNYVEGAAYVGILPLLLSLPALLSRRFRRRAMPFAALAAVSLLFVFGTPLYRLIFLLPGMDQLHTPFRWVFPYTFSLAALAGMGLTALGEGDAAAARVGRWLARPALIAAALLLAGLVVAVIYPGPFLALAQRVLDASEMTRRAYGSAATLLSYQWRNLAILAVATLGSAVAMLALIARRRLGRLPLGAVLAAAVLTADLFFVGYGFNPRANPDWLLTEPPVVEYLRRDVEPWRLTTFIAPGEKPFNANAGMIYGFEDIRGYDSIIPRQYVDFMGLIEPQDELLYNRIAPLSQPAALDSPLLDLLNVKYVLTTQAFDRPGLELVYDGELRVYRNESAMPRAFALTCAQRVPAANLAQTLTSADVRRCLVLDGEAAETTGSAAEPLPVSVLERGQNEIVLLADLPEPAWVVYGDAYAPGWRAYAGTVGSAEPEQQVEIERAYGALRAVHLPAGQWQVRLKYMPRSFQVGLYGSFIAGVTLLMLLVAWLWQRYYRHDDDDHTARRVAKNSLTPMALSLLNKLIDMAFAMLVLRILAPAGAGRYQFAVTFIGYFEIVVRFGLGTLVTREVARDRQCGERYLSNSLALRVLFWLGSLPVMALLLLAYVLFSGLSTDVVAAVGLFAVSVFLGNFSDAYSSVFYAHERMEQPAFIATATTLLRCALGAIVLLAGGGFIGLAGVSVLSSAFTVVALGVQMRRQYFRPRIAFERGFARSMVSQSFPLMLNHLLATVFFQVDVLLLQPMRGDIEVGYYSAAYRYIRGLDIIPGYFTMALFPVMARYAVSARDSLQRAYQLSLRLLFLVSLPIAMGTTFIARELILVLAGSDYVGGSTIALQILIWYMPLGFVNSVTQYVLIALDEQRYLTRAFVIGVGFNLAGNLILIPRYGYVAAAAVTVVSEFALLVPFMSRVYRHLQPVPWLDLTWRPVLATLGMGALMAVGRMARVPVLAVIPLAGIAYAGILLALGVTRSQDMDLVVGLFRRRLSRGQPSAASPRA